MTKRTIGSIWLIVVTITSAGVALRLAGVLTGDTLDFVIGLGGLAISFTTLGTLILRDNPRQRVGALFFVLGCNEAVVVVLRIFATSMNAHSYVAGTVGVFEEALRIAGIPASGLLLLIFPTGRLVSPRWRIVVVLLAAAAVGGVASTALTPGHLDGLPTVLNPWATEGTAPVARVLANAGGLGAIAIVLVVASIALRYRRASDPERRQIKAFSLSVVFVVAVIVGTTLAFPAQMNNGLLGSLIWQLPWLIPPATAGVAIVRHGLFDIDRVISRTLSYAIISAVLAGTFALIVLVPSALVGSQGAPPWLVATATLAVAFLFQPVRRHVQRTVDHRFNRARYDAVNTIESFSARLREQIDMEALQTELSHVITRTMQPAHVGLWLTPSRRS